ncbi:methyltransferase domain-containing protein [Oxynema aestuarii]|uniref:Methyltransferase domain-containing protein n=1 Tax=Oxynema aestuarii AP17 TaxID=2064643 RepID=A0A6H1TTU7_9CYAN|nr:methyltransferase domain-containing protein [Oxynema aestuarii]QIZ69370.1 methyltransferase domain-containing protein [Oxynema aestuarii AP17]
MDTTENFNNAISHLLRCPKCKSKLLYLEGCRGLKCPIHGIYPVIDEIPCFVQSNHPENINYHFDSHWDENITEQIPIQKQLVAQEFLKPLFDCINLQKPALLLDAGCGNGVHARVLSTQSWAKSSDFVGLDISLSALRSAARDLHKSSWKFVQGDLGELPFEDGQFDAAFSFGAIAYTDNPLNSFSELCRVTKKGGLVGVWIYPKTGGLMGVLFSTIRSLCQVTGSVGSRLIADCIVPFLGVLPTRSGINLANSTWKQCREVVLVNIAPDQLFFPTTSEVESWFSDYGLEIISQDDDNPITIWGKKL